MKKKLILNKEIIAELNNVEQLNIKGGSLGPCTGTLTCTLETIGCTDSGGADTCPEFCQGVYTIECDSLGDC